MTSILTQRIRRRLTENQRPFPRRDHIIGALCDEKTAPPDHERLKSLAEAVAPDLTGAGALQGFLDDPDVTDVVVNGPDQVWIDRGHGLEHTDTCFPDADTVGRLASRLAGSAGRRLDASHPYVDVCLHDGTRLHAILPPLATRGPYLSLRTHRPRAFDLNQLRDNHTVDHVTADLLRRIIDARLAFLITGGTGTGKTTLMNTLLSHISHSERIILVEDNRELKPAHPHTVGLQARTANPEGHGHVELSELIRQALRMRPDRIIVGECRGVEVTELLSALNTGHDGGAGTLHCNTARDVPARLEALALPGGADRTGLHAQISAALRVIVHLHRTKRQRYVDHIALIDDSDSGLEVSTAYSTRGHGVAWNRLLRLLEERGA